MKRDNTYLKGNQFAKGSKPNKTCFKKGDVPWNKGLKGIHLSPKTEFKKGLRSSNWQPVGTITIRTSKRETRRFIKVAEPDKWEEYAKFLWKQKYGKVLKGYAIHHIDGDKLNDDIKNLIALSISEHMKLHSGLVIPTQEQLEQYISRAEARVRAIQKPML